jgi:hypothetical protein
MKLILKILSAVGLGLTILPSMLVFSGAITWQTHAGLMVAGMLVWFATAPGWMKISRS